MRQSAKSRTLSLLLVVTALVPMLLITAFSTFTYTKNAEALETDKLQFLLSSRMEELNKYVEYYSDWVSSAANTSIVRSVLTKNSDSNFDANEYFASISDSSVSANDIRSVSIVDKMGNVSLYSGNTETGAKSADNFFEDDFASTLRKSLVTPLKDGKSVDGFDIAAPVYDGDKKYLGYISFTVGCDYFREIVGNTENFDSAQIIVLDSLGNVCASNFDDRLFDSLIDSFWEKADDGGKELLAANNIKRHNVGNDKYTICFSPTDDNTFYVLCALNRSAVFAGLWDYFKIFGALVLFTILIIIFCHNLTNQLYGKPLVELVNTMKKVYDGDYSVRYLSDKNDEFGTLGKTFNVLVSKIQRETTIQNENAQIIEKLAFEDSLVGCRNLNKFMIDAESILGRNQDKKYAIIQFDVNKFKMINEMFGYDEGNRALKHISNVVSANLDESEIYARANNDNFVVLMSYVEPEELVTRMKEIIENSSNVKDSNERYKLSFSAGIYKINDYNQGVKLMINKASMAQKTIKEKQETTDCIIFYDTDLRLTMIAEKVIENQMHVALENNEFVVYLQPKYDIVRNKIIGAEALVRWITSDGNLISPGQFIPLFEKNGFVVNIDFYVLETVCQLIREWLDNGLEPVRISVNQSRLHLSNPNYVSSVYSIIEKYGVPTEYIEFEITESAFMNDISSMMRVMTDLHALGFHISIDDFGSGFSSLNILKELPFDVLKIDREFLNETSDSIRSKTVVIYVVSMAKKLEIDVICEGVETQEQADFLREIGCYAIQGYFFAKPLPIKDFERLLFKQIPHEAKSK